ncbi:NFX1-type zinc finger-containing protein 1 [Mizuhopecten yessoensis]|uniref:NFX1-type zinc finger-containing protein 1 n=2 Tax=Mizuhopecten yessoensis TaxID=6573 RepID=A0A210QVY1_MIZYE|nr:NFX1-type zinc finger-containing protein 1 [Mizuhopecten yessoensis]
MKDFLNRFEALVVNSNSSHPRSLADFGKLRSPADHDLGLVLKPGISALYNNPKFEERQITDSFENSRSLLERVYYLYKEDITRPLVRGLRKLRHYLKNSTDLEKFRDDDIRVFRDLQIISSIASQSNGLIWEMQLDTTQPLVKTIMNRHRRLLQRGTLICISNDVFKRDIVYGTIVESDKKEDMTRNGIVRVEFQQSFTINQGNSGQLFTLVESKSNCVAYIDALIAVQVQLDANEQLPFEQQIVYHQQNFNPPGYLTCEHDDKRRISFECLRMKSDIRKESIEARNSNDETGIVKDILEGMLSNICAERSDVHIFETETWATPDELGMDISQYRAFSDGLTQGLSLIQGPPGTGKTVIALNILEMMLNNQNVWSKEIIGPIILLSYTNHALDQFLEGITRMPIMKSARCTDIVRVGSRCKTESLDKYNLAHRRKERHTKIRKKALLELHVTADHHKELSEATRTYLTSLVHEDFLRQVNAIPENLFWSLKERIISSLPSDGTYLCKWLRIFVDDFVLQKRENAECFDTSEEMESAENTSNDRFGLGIDLEDFEFESILLKDLDRAKDLMKQPTPILTSETEEDLNKGIKYWSFISPKAKLAVLQEVKRRIMQTKPMSEAEECSIADVWVLSVDDRWRLYKLWINKILRTLKDDMMSVQMSYKSAYGRCEECRHSKDIEIFKNARVVAMTTSRAAIDHGKLRRINSKIMVIEEAAEVPDHHILASLVPSLQHLVMIGDHLQLRPGYNDYKTAMRFGLNVSIFERLIRTGLKFQQLQFQHRMRPVIADLLTPSIYSELQNHASVMEITDVRGLQNNMFFLNHSENEHADSHQDKKSHKNQHEVDFIAQLYRYLRLQGYDSGDITVLTTYKEQERLLQRAIRTIEKSERFVFRKPKTSYCDLNSKQTGSDKTGPYHISKYSSIDALQLENFEECKETSPGARVTTVDNFQGEENKIILLSLVRSNSKGQIGFLNEPNRICVALSRAKAGLYIIGDFNLLRKKNDLWRQILHKAETKGCVGSSLTLYCKNHPQTKTNVSKAVDFQKVHDGGCSQKCSVSLVCGHDCPRRCHTDDPNHELITCKSICEKPCSLGHKCQYLCYKCHEECLPCKVKVLKTLPNCGHNVPVPCFEKLDECICTEPCRSILECGHQCQRKCGTTCNNSENCDELVKVTADCGHDIQTACHSKKDPICSVKCRTKLTCGHLCKGTCRSCFSGHLHQQCREKIQFKLKCGHTIAIDCILEYWEQTYGGHLEKCPRDCKWQCKHLACKKRCGESCTRWPCNVRCTQRLRCSHLCALLLCDHNGAHWCVECSRDLINGGLPRTQLNVRNPHYIRLQRCMCIFQTEVLDAYLMHQEETSPRCPKCRKDIIDMRYHNLLKRTRRLTVSGKKCRNKDYIKLRNSLQEVLGILENIAERFIPDVSLDLKYKTVFYRISYRLERSRNAFSVQELRDLSLIVPKMVISLKMCKERSKSNPESMSEELSSHLEVCENKCSSIFANFMEDIKIPQSGTNDELNKFANTTSKGSTLMMILPSIQQLSA